MCRVSALAAMLACVVACSGEGFETGVGDSGVDTDGGARDGSRSSIGGTGGAAGGATGATGGKASSGAGNSGSGGATTGGATSTGGAPWDAATGVAGSGAGGAATGGATSTGGANGTGGASCVAVSSIHRCAAGSDVTPCPACSEGTRSCQDGDVCACKVNVPNVGAKLVVPGSFGCGDYIPQCCVGFRGLNGAYCIGAAEPCQ